MKLAVCLLRETLQGVFPPIITLLSFHIKACDFVCKRKSNDLYVSHRVLHAEGIGT